jgi:hypothetical protein
MGTRTVILTKAGSREHQENVFVPDKQGNETDVSFQGRIISFLNQKYGLDGWKDPPQTAAGTAARNVFFAADQNKTVRNQLERLQKRATNSIKKLDKWQK